MLADAEADQSLCEKLSLRMSHGLNTEVEKKKKKKPPLCMSFHFIHITVSKCISFGPEANQRENKVKDGDGDIYSY